MAVAQRMSEEAYQEFVLSGVDGLWELYDGRLVEKPGMSWEHTTVVSLLVVLLQVQLDIHKDRVLAESRVRRAAAMVFIPDVMVVPAGYGDPFRGKPGTPAIFSDTLPLVVEVWSSSTGDYDVNAKLPIYQQRGDLEIGLIHPYDRTLTSWVRQPDGSYRETTYHDGVVSPAALPGVAIDLERLFAA